MFALFLVEITLTVGLFLNLTGGNYPKAEIDAEVGGCTG
jgi:hypothetical protein